MTKFLNISTDTTLGGNAPSDELAVSQKAIKTYVDNHSGGGGSSTLAGLSDVTITSATSGQVLKYDGSKWINGTGDSMPTGMIFTFGGSTAPTGCLVCDGSAISRTTYAALFAVIGTTYGSGDGSTTFNLPEKYAYTGGVVGNGVSLGWEGAEYNSSGGHGGTVAYQEVGSNNQTLFVSTSAYGQSVGSYSGTGAPFYNDYNVGITTEADKSGIECEKDANTIVCIKY